MDIVKKILIGLFNTIQIIDAIYILIPFALLIIYFFYKILHLQTALQQKKKITDHNFQFGIIITAHQDTKLIHPLIDSIEKQSYKKFKVYLVADDCDINSLNYKSDQIKILRPEEPLNSKVKSIQFALNNFSIEDDVVLILDADNLIHPSFLCVLNKYFQKGYKVVQAGFNPKNTSSNFAKMDAIGDLYNFFVEREVRMMIGLSAAIWGSGIAIEKNIYREVEFTDFLGGFDKKLQAYLVQRVETIAYAPEAILFDEKTSTPDSLEKQRIRWISTYFKYFRESIHIFLSGIYNKNFNQIYFGFNTLRPPLFLILEIAFVTTAIDWFIDKTLYYDWLYLLACFFFTFLTIIIIKGKDKRLIKTIFLLPIFVFKQTVSFFKLSKAKKTFLKTEHSNIIYIDQLVDPKNTIKQCH